MLTSIIFLSVIVALAGVAIYQHSFVVIAKRKRQTLRRGIEKEREATADIISLSRDTINAGMSEDEFLERFIEYAVRSLKGSGGAVLKDSQDGKFQGVAVTGIFPPLKEVPPQIEDQLMAHAKKHTEYIKGLFFDVTAASVDNLCIDNGFALFKNVEMPSWVPAGFKKSAPVMLLAPIKISTRTKACAIIVSDNDFESHVLRHEDGRYLLRLVAIASLAIEVIRVFKERQEYEERLQSAREEGMIQVSTGIIHNIGNAVTVAKLAIRDLQEKMPSNPEERPDQFIVSEILPLIKASVEKGEAAQFLSSDPVGRQCLQVMEELLAHSSESSKEAVKLLKSLSSKLNHISEIIELQQRFVGELGTENMTHLADVVESSIKIFEESFNKRNVAIETSLDRSVPEVLIDPSMLTQVLINIVKNAIEAIDSESSQDKKYKLEIKLSKDEFDGKGFASVSVADNGPGMPDEVKARIFEFGFSTKRQNAGGYGLHSCLATIKKYGGLIHVDSALGQGTCFKVSIPVGSSSQGSAAA